VTYGTVCHRTWTHVDVRDICRRTSTCVRRLTGPYAVWTGLYWVAVCGPEIKRYPVMSCRQWVVLQRPANWLSHSLSRPVQYIITR